MGPSIDCKELVINTMRAVGGCGVSSNLLTYVPFHAVMDQCSQAIYLRKHTNI